MAITIRANVQTANGAGTSITLTKNTGISNGDVLFAAISFRGGTGVTISTPSGMTATTRFDNGTDNISTVCFWRAIDGSEGASWAWTLGSSQSYEAKMIALVPPDTTSPVDAIDGQATTGPGQTTCTAPSVSPTGSTDLLLFIGAACRSTALSAGAPTSAPSGYTIIGSDLINSVTTAAGNLSQHVSYKTLSASGATGAATNSYSNTHRFLGMHVAILELSAAPTFPILNLPQNTLVRM